MLLTPAFAPKVITANIIIFVLKKKSALNIGCLQESQKPKAKSQRPDFLTKI